MESGSRVIPVLGHLAWLAERINDPVNDGRARDAALLVFNAAAILHWRFVAPVSYGDTVANELHRTDASRAIDGLVRSSEKIVAKAEHADSDQDRSLRVQLTAKIHEVVTTVSRSMLLSEPYPARLPELEASPNVRELLDEFLGVHAKQYADAILKGRYAGAKGGGGADAGLNEAVAGLIYAYDHAREVDTSPMLRRSLAQMAAGFFKTAVEIQPDDLPAAQEKRLQGLANTLIGNAAAT